MALLSSVQTTSRFTQYEYRLLGLLLFSLLLAIMLVEDADISRSILIVHFGLFLLWQPILKQEASFSTLNLVLLLSLILGFIIWFNLWLSVFWMLLLLSLLTGRIFARGLGRAAYGLAVLIIFLQLTLIMTPSLFKLPALTAGLHTASSLFLLCLSLTLVLIPSRHTQSSHIDFIRGLLVVLLTLFLCMGSALVTYSSSIPYLQSLAGTIIIASLFLLTLAILWTPRAGFSGLAQLWEKYLLNIGGPFEQWVSRLASIEANSEIKPEQFLHESIEHLLSRHWVSGVHWQTHQAEQLVGNTSNHHTVYMDDKLQLTLYAHNSIGPALLLHSKLLLSVLTFYYRAKLQEQQLIKQAHLRAIHETGSILTHDVKNILQSTQTMTQILQDEEQITDGGELLKQQLPLLTQRLKTTLDKLVTPEHADITMGSIISWWTQLSIRYQGQNISFSDNIDCDRDIPLDVFDSITENLLENARSKRIEEPGLQIKVSLFNNKEAMILSVCDTGSMIKQPIVEQLFKEPLDSESGFGIGLYQAYQQAQHHHYHLALSNNRKQQVCFTLSTLEDHGANIS